MDMKQLSGTVTFLFTDIEGSTKLLLQLGEEYEKILSDHNRILRNVITKFGGEEQDNAGDGFFIVFDKVRNAVESAAEIQRIFSTHNWGNGFKLKVRMGIHTGEVNKNESGFVGIEVNRASRIGAAGHGGQVLISESTKVLVSNDLPDGINIKDLGEFNLKDFDKPEKIFQLEIDNLQNSFPPLKSQSVIKSNLNFQITKLIGREKETADIQKLILDENIRLITLTGPGGTGKTSLAYSVCKSLISCFDDGVFAVSLESVSDYSLVSQAISQTIGLIECPSKPIIKTITEFLKEKKMLLLLDNFEQIISAADIISEIMESCPGVKILVTSRIVLLIKYETEYSIQPLAFPKDTEFNDNSNFSEYSAVRLFTDRAKSVNPDFEITPANINDIAEICRRLDGLPLAIELASARTKLFTPKMILSKLENKFDILKSTSKLYSERHQTLKQAISWSYELLTESEKKIFRWISVFSGGFSFEAAKNIFSGMKEHIPEITDGIEALLNKSLLRRKDDSNYEPRFYMLETIREFSSECIEDDEKNILMPLYVNYYLSLAEEAEPNLSKEGMEYWLNKLEHEEFNLRKSLNWAFENKDSETALRMCGALLKYRIIRGNLVEGLREIMKAIDMPRNNMICAFRAKALNAAGTIVHEISDYKNSLKLLEESASIYKKLKDENGIAAVLNNISWVNIHLGNVRVAKRICKVALNLNVKLNNLTGIAVAKNNLAWLAFQQGEFEKAVSLNIENESIRTQTGDSRGIAFAKINRAWAEIMLGRFEEALISLDIAIEMIADLKDRQLYAWANNIKGSYYHSLGDYESFESCVNKSMNIMKEIGNKWVICYETVWLGHIKYDKGDYDSAKRLLKEGVKLFNINESKWGGALSLLLYGYVYLKENDIDNAEIMFKKSLALSVETGNKHFIMLCFNAIAEISVIKKDFAKAVKLICTSEKLKKITKYHFSVCEFKKVENNIRILKQYMKPELIKKFRKISVADAVKIAMK